MSHYSTLGVSQTATQDEIKKAYRQLAIKHHPDKNGGSKSSEDTFKKISDSYAVLSDATKRAEYDNLSSKKGRGPSSFGFDDFVNSFSRSDFKSSSDRARRSQGKTHTPPPNTNHLDINIEWVIDLADALTGTKVNIEFTRHKINYTSSSGNVLNYTIIDEEKEVVINIDLTKKAMIIKEENGKYIAIVRLSKLGNEDVINRTDIWGEVEQVPIFGDVYIKLEIRQPEWISIKDNIIIHRIDLTLSKILFPDEKIEIETIFNKKYAVNFNMPQDISNLKFSIPSVGLIDDKGIQGAYLVRFNIVLPDIDLLSIEDSKKLKSLLLDCENKT
jgi:DnaJ-class molecular chaperone